MPSEFVWIADIPSRQTTRQYAICSIVKLASPVQGHRSARLMPQTLVSAEVLIDGRSSPSESGHLLEYVGELQHTEIIAIAPDDLDADGQTVVGKSGRH